MVNDLVTPDELSGLPGAPFTVAEVDAAVVALRSILGWHVAPQRTDTVEMDVNWPSRWVTLPTKHLVSVAEVRDADTGNVISAATYRTSKHVHALRQRGHWAAGYESLEVDMTHGFDACPADLLTIVAEVASASRGSTKGSVVTQVTNGQYSMSLGELAASTAAPFSTAATLARYSVYDEPVIA